MFNLFSRTDVPGFRVEPQDDVPGFNVAERGFNVAEPDFNIGQNGLPGQTNVWSDGTSPGSCPHA